MEDTSTVRRANPFAAGQGVLCLGIGGGGDVVGALHAALIAREAGLHAVVGGVTWERRPVDPLPGPRRLDEIDGADALNAHVALAGPDTTGPGGFRFAESHMSAVLGERTVLVDPHGGPAALADGLDDAAARLGCDAIALVDVGGDVLAHGDEPGLASPLCDALLLAAAEHARLPCTGAVFGVGCDGELTPEEVLERLAEVAAAGGSRGAQGITPAHADALEAAVAKVPTEASAMAVRCARGEHGRGPIRDGRRTVPLSPLGAVTFLFDARAAVRSAARLAHAVRDAASLHDAHETLTAMGIRTELRWEQERAGELGRDG
jgi:hypothetical protein